MKLAAPSAASPDPPRDHSASTFADNIAVFPDAIAGLLGNGRHLVVTALP